MNTEFTKEKPQQNNSKTVKMRGRPRTVDRSYENDPYVQKWFVGLDKTTKGNYLRQFKEWLDFIKMSPTEQIEKRIKDMNSTDLTERQFFENKWREFKAYLEEKTSIGLPQLLPHQNANRIICFGLFSYL